MEREKKRKRQKNLENWSLKECSNPSKVLTPYDPKYGMSSYTLARRNFNYHLEWSLDNRCSSEKIAFLQEQNKKNAYPPAIWWRKSAQKIKNTNKNQKFVTFSQILTTNDEIEFTPCSKK